MGPHGGQFRGVDIGIESWEVRRDQSARGAAGE